MKVVPPRVRVDASFASIGMVAWSLGCWVAQEPNNSATQQLQRRTIDSLPAVGNHQMRDDAPVVGLASFDRHLLLLSVIPSVSEGPGRRCGTPVPPTPRFLTTL